MDFSIHPLWVLADPVTVEQAAALIAGYDPSSVCFDSGWPDFFRTETGLTDSSGIREVQVIFSALINAIEGGKLQARLRYKAEPRYVAGIDNLSEQAYLSGEVAEIKDIDECRINSKCHCQRQLQKSNRLLKLITTDRRFFIA